MPEERTLVLVEDISNTAMMEGIAKRLGGGMTGTLPSENAATFSFPTKQAAHDFIFSAKHQGYQAKIQTALFPGVFSPLDALREDAERIRRALKKPRARPPWSQ